MLVVESLLVTGSDLRVDWGSTQGCGSQTFGAWSLGKAEISMAPEHSISKGQHGWTSTRWSILEPQMRKKTTAHALRIYLTQSLPNRY